MDCENNTNYFFYDNVIEYFKSKMDKNKSAKAIYNKIINNEEYKKTYTLEDIKTFCETIGGVSVEIINIMTNEIIHININKTNRFKITFLNDNKNIKHTYLNLFINMDKINEIKKVNKEETFLKSKISSRIKFYKLFDDKIKNKYPNENINLKTINTKEAYDFIKEKKITHCPICKDEILYYNYEPYCLYQFSFDRINNKKIHHLNNIQITCYNCNILKSDNDCIDNKIYRMYNCGKKENCYNGCHKKKEYWNDEIKNEIKNDKEYKKLKRKGILYNNYYENIEKINKMSK